LRLVTGPAALIDRAAALPVRTLYWNACVAGVLLIVAGTAFIASVTATGSTLGLVSVILSGAVVVGVWLWGTLISPRGWRSRVVGMWVLAALLGVRSVSWFVAAGLTTQGAALAGATLVGCLAAPAFGVALLSWALQVRAQPPTSTSDFRRLWRRWIYLQSLMAAVLLIVGGALVGLAQ
jgi:hypothetical protein